MSDVQETELVAYLTLALIPGIGSQRFRMLVQHFGSASAVLGAPFGAFAHFERFPRALASAIVRADPRSGARVLAALEPVGGVLLLPGDSRFPAGLETIPEPPVLLFASGNLALLERPAVAIVGSRDHSQYGGEVCRALARAAALAGLAVVSGMARGLDALAHRGALDATGATIGVLGNGLGVVYPAANRKLYDEVAARGLLLSEFPPGERPSAGSFPRRNRLISGLARVTVVVEAASGSGALQTAECALEQGRTVMAVPGQITSAVSYGTNDLLRDGAGPVLELPDLLGHFPELRCATGSASEPWRAAPPLARRLLKSLSVEPLLPEQLVELSGGPVDAALDALSSLELDGHVTRDAAGRYRLKAELFG